MSAGSNRTDTVVSSPLASSNWSVLSTSPSKGKLTVTSQIAVLFPAIAVITVVPVPTALTLPASTVATFSLLLVHVTLYIPSAKLGA